MQTCGNLTYLLQKPGRLSNNNMQIIYWATAEIYQVRTIDGPSISNNSLYNNQPFIQTILQSPLVYKYPKLYGWGEYTKQQYTFFLDLYYELTERNNIKSWHIHSNTNILCLSLTIYISL